MPASSIMQFMDDRLPGGDEPLYWGRADVDGAPYAGRPPLLSEEEAETRLVTSYHVQSATLDSSDPEDEKKLTDIVKRCCNGWYRMLQFDREFIADEKKWLYRCIWAIPVMRDGQPMHSQRPMTGVPND